MTSRLPKPSGLKIPMKIPERIPQPLATISENKINRAHEAPASISRFVPSTRLKRRSKSVTDLTGLLNKAPSISSFRPTPLTAKTLKVNKVIVEKNVVSTKKNITKPVPKPSAKRPATTSKSNEEGPSKPKMLKKIPDWDYKNRFLQLKDQFTVLKQEHDELKESSSELETYKSIHKIYKEKYEVLEKKHIETTNQLESTTKESISLKDSLESLTELHKQLTKEHDELTKKHKEILAENEDLNKENTNLKKCLGEKECKNEEQEELINVLKLETQNLNVERRVLHNRIQELKGNIRVFCRVRPPINAEEEKRLQCNIDFLSDTTLEIKKNKENVNQITGKVQESKSEFIFDRVFTQESTQEEVFEDLSQLVQSALDGYHVCVFAYGQTGSGKTYTMQGEESARNRGIIPRTIDFLFSTIAKLEGLGWKYEVHASFLEIYNENVRDLLNINGTQKLDIFYNEGKGTTVSNLTIQPIETADHLTEYMRLAQQNRATAATDFNEHSSRSHAVTKIYLEGVSKEQNIVYSGSINLVDLAGSESAKHTLSDERLSETKNINKSLATLGNVIAALFTKRKHIPYRNSKLTYLLQSSLGGNSKTLMLVNISPFDECFLESINSLRFASKVKEVQTDCKRNKMLALPSAKQKSIVGNYKS